MLLPTILIHKTREKEKKNDSRKVLFSFTYFSYLSMLFSYPGHLYVTLEARFSPGMEAVTVY